MGISELAYDPVRYAPSTSPKYRHGFKRGVRHRKYNDLLRSYLFDQERKKKDFAKIFELMRQVGQQRYISEERGKKWVQEKKAHKETHIEYKKIISDKDKEIAYLKKEIEKQKSVVSNAVLMKNRQINKEKQERAIKNRYRRRLDEYENKFKLINRTNNFFAKEFKWSPNSITDQKVELMLRSITSFQALVDQNILTHTEVVYLSVGYQKEYFSKEDVQIRFGEKIVRYWIRDTKKLIAAGFIKKVFGKDYFYLTPIGNNRMKDILKHIFQVKYPSYYKEPKQQQA